MERYEFYKGYVPVDDKAALMPYKGKSSDELLTLEEAEKFSGYGGVLNDNTIVVDADTNEEYELLLKIVKERKLGCRVYKSNRGGHFLFLNNGMQRTKKVHNGKWMTAIGLANTDLLPGTRASYEVLKKDGVTREVVYDAGEYETVPKWLMPVTHVYDFKGMEIGDGRNQTMYNYILTLQSNDFNQEEARECIGVINEFIFDEPMDPSELETVTRDEAFMKPVFFKGKEFLFDRFAKFMMNTHHILKINNALHIYRDGIYKRGDKYIENAMTDYIPTLTKAKRHEVLAYLDIMILENSKQSDACYIAFKNGIYNIDTKEFCPFSPEIIITNVIPHNYNPYTYSEIVDKTLNKLAVNDPNIRALLEEVIGYTFYRRNELRKSFILTGDKRNGKSTYLDMINCLLGEENTTAIDLGELGERFKTAELAGKLACVGDDIDDEFIKNSSLFKKMAAGNRANVEKKGQDPFDFYNYAKLLFSANDIPRIKDKTGAALDRIVIVPFDATFSKDDPDFDPYIKYKLIQEDCMEYLINLGIAGLTRVLENYDFTTSAKVEKEIQEYRENNNPVLSFFKEQDFEVDINNQPTTYVYRRYTVFCADNNFTPLSQAEFSKQVKKEYGVVNPVRSVNGKKCRVFVR